MKMKIFHVLQSGGAFSVKPLPQKSWTSHPGVVKLPADMPTVEAAKTWFPRKKLSLLFAGQAGRMALHWMPAAPIDDAQILRFCRDNECLRVEQTAEGELIILPPVGMEGSNRNFLLYAPFGIWQQQAGGECFDSSAGFRLPNGALRSPDVSWVRQEQLDKLTPEQRGKFPKLCPDFVLELRSRTDRLPVLKDKLAEYLDNGARLGWLIDPFDKQVFVYRPGQPVEHLTNPATLSGEGVLPGFTLDLARVW